ncbi:Electron transfer flavoprotein-ubiquinone oxidoreductase [Mycena sanguinolenta]|uniref:Electron transfer flavoprotein-ubiquinone oxidoreductase n=1 Tax=Mycena sanguinolenta TaxID=230812 RepID=A0A8H7CEZ6_9AGAR|nr:Electron transfer flavoprotein-ubiquinone oxidoreductase [Mycena sanguinolenta]
MLLWADAEKDRHAVDVAFAALHSSVKFVSTTSPKTFSVNPQEESSSNSESTSEGEQGIISLSDYTSIFPSSAAHTDLYATRNVRHGFNTRAGMWGWVVYAGFDTMLNGRVPWTLRHHEDQNDFRLTDGGVQAHRVPPLSTDLISNVTLTGTNHQGKQFICGL